MIPEKVVYYDMDETLVLWNYEPTNEILNKLVTVDGTGLLPNESMIISMKRNKIRGFGIILWTHSSMELANKIVKALGLEKVVDLIIPKPVRYYDDRPVEEWIGVWIDSKKYTVK